MPSAKKKSRSPRVAASAGSSRASRTAKDEASTAPGGASVRAPHQEGATAAKRSARQEHTTRPKHVALPKGPETSARARRKTPSKKEERPPKTKLAIVLLSDPLRERALIGEALRERGLDEHAIAGGYVHVVQTLTAKTDTTGNVDKLLVDVLKECSRHLAPAERAGAHDAPVFVQLIHNVPRPERTGRPAAPKTSPEFPPTPAPALDETSHPAVEQDSFAP